MALTESLPVYRDVYKLIRLLFDYSRNFSREYKYTLGQDIKRDSITLVRSIYRANRSKAKTEYLEEFLDNFEILKLEIRPRGVFAVVPKNSGKNFHLTKASFMPLTIVAYPLATLPHRFLPTSL